MTLYTLPLGLVASQRNFHQLWKCPLCMAALIEARGSALCVRGSGTCAIPHGGPARCHKANVVMWDSCRVMQLKRICLDICAYLGGAPICEAPVSF